MKTKQYEGSVYIGIVGGENIPYDAARSFYSLSRRPVDSPPYYIAATKGYEARQSHINKFMESKHDFILLLDHDMTFPENALERLLSHKLPYVSGFYLRRMFDPMAPIWFENVPAGTMPIPWYTGGIEANQLYKIGASGWGCVLIHRDVITETRKLLKGEPEIIEDDMDVYPYDLKRVTQAINTLGNLADNPPERQVLLPALREYTQVLRDEIKVLRGIKDNVGSDVRFPFFAKLAGFQLYGDSGVCCEHILSYPLKARDWIAQGEGYWKAVKAETSKAYKREKARIAEARAGLQ